MPVAFVGGKKVYRSLNSLDSKIKEMTPPETVVISLKQHIGTPAKCVVSLGEYVTVGQLIGEADGDYSANVHSSVSGIVCAIELDENGIYCIKIENDGSNTASDPTPYTASLLTSTPERLVEEISKFGIVGRGGAGFPTHTKLKNTLGNVNKFLINCVESEPFMTKDAALLREYPADIVSGIKIMMKILQIKKADVFVGEQMLEQGYNFLNYLKDRSFIDVNLCDDKYPQGDERQLIAAVYKTEIPYDRLPPDTFSVVFNVETCFQIYDCLSKGAPITRSLISVDGDGIETPQNILVPLGTSIADVIKFCGGLKDNCKCVVVGGSMMGDAVNPFDTYVTKTTSSITCFKNPPEHKGEDCIRCGRCEDVCPMHIPVPLLNRLWEIDDISEAKINMAHICVGCGVCTYVCPSDLPLKDRVEELREKIIMEAENE